MNLFDYIQGINPNAAGPASSPTFPVQPHPCMIAKSPSIWDRVKRGLFDIQGTEDYLSPEQMEQGRRAGLLGFGSALMASPNDQTLVQSIGGALGAGQQASKSAIADAMQMREFGIKEQERQRTQAETEAAKRKRADIVARFPAPANETFMQRLTRMSQRLPEFAAANDIDMVRSITELLKPYSSLFEPDDKDVRITDDVIGPDGKPYKVYYDAKTGQEIRREPQFKEPKDRSTQENMQEQRMYQRERDLARDYQAIAKSYGPVG